MIKKQLYKRFIAPRQEDEDTRNREFVLNVILAGTSLVTVLSFLLLLLSLALGNHVIMRFGAVVAMGMIIGGIYYLSRSGRFRAAAYVVVALYSLVAILVGLSWGVSMPVTVVLFGLVIVLAGILIGAKYSLYAMLGTFIAVVGIKILEEQDIVQPNLSWTTEPSNSGTLVGFMFVFGIIAVVSWLFNYRMERSLHRAERAERALKRQKQMLERTVEKRTQELQAAQLEKVQELYKFAELGQLSTALMHDLANHLTTLTLDIESLGAEHRSSILQRAKRSMRYIDDMVIQVRNQLHGKGRTHAFSVATETKAVIDILRHKADQAEVKVVWESETSNMLRTKGDTLRFRQLLANIVSNGIDAYADMDAKARRQVVVRAERKGNTIHIAVEDWGKGVDPKLKDKLFEPFYGNKKSGLGLGLFIAKQIARDHFSGDIKITADKNHTIFTVSVKAYP